MLSECECVSLWRNYFVLFLFVCGDSIVFVSLCAFPTFSIFPSLRLGTFFVCAIIVRCCCSSRVAIDADILVYSDDVIHLHVVTPFWPMRHAQTSFRFEFGFAAFARFVSPRERWEERDTKCNDYWFDINGHTLAQRTNERTTKQSATRARLAERRTEETDAIAEWGVGGNEIDEDRFKAL